MKQRKHSGIQRKYLKYTIALLAIALMLSCIGVWAYVGRGMTSVVVDKYEFMTKQMGVELDNLFEKSDEVTAGCIQYEDVQKSLQSQGLDDVRHLALSKYFAYVDMKHIADYCYVDNKGNVYARSYSDVTYEDVLNSKFETYLEGDYAKTKWFWAKDTLFGSKEPALFIGRYVRNMDYPHEPGMLFFKMDNRFLQEIMAGDEGLTEGTASGVFDAKGEVCFLEAPEHLKNNQLGDSIGKAISDATIQYMHTNEMAYGVSKMILSGEPVKDGIVFAYHQGATKMTAFSYVPYTVLHAGMSKVFIIFILIYVLVIMLAILLSIYFSKRFTKPIEEIKDAMTGFDGNDFERRIELHTGTELDEIGDSYNKMLENIKLLLEEIKEQEKELRTSEMNLLISQINPHFLYNTLDTIYMLARITKEERTMKMIQALSKYLRLCLSKGEEIVTLKDELENVKSYMEIQQIRNENLFTYEVDCKVDASTTWVLKLILQPLVENAVKHGFCDLYDGGIIKITIEREGEMLVLSVYNSGSPIKEEVMNKINAMNTMALMELKSCFPDKKKGYGVVNIMTRLRLKYGEEVRFLYRAKKDGTTCIIKIPGGGAEELL